MNGTLPTASAPNPTKNLDLVDMACGLAEAAERFGIPAPPGAPVRAWVRLAGNPTFDAWLMWWPPGGAVDFHDHGGSAGAIVVLSGSLVEVQPGHRRPRRRVLRKGATRTITPDAVHDVVNEGATPAVSVHVYSPPLTTMTFYDPDGREPLRVTPVHDDGPRLDAAATFGWTGAP
ncbi:MAG: putative cysteine dioxygenase [Actinomycetia bacterium]|nr:putative cysteine dioxygenase [Actinomycetes bacterium]